MENAKSIIVKHHFVRYSSWTSLRVFFIFTNGAAGSNTRNPRNERTRCWLKRRFGPIVSCRLIDLHSEMLFQHETLFHRPSRHFFCCPHPSCYVYSDVVCRQRIRDMKKMQDEQFKAEIKNLGAMQQSAYDQIRFHRFVYKDKNKMPVP